MCQAETRFKFCTCSAEDDIGWPRWELWRSSDEGGSDALHVVGSIMPPALDYVLVVERLERDLNHPGAFDIDIDAREGDSLVLAFSPEREYSFKLKDGTWRERLWGAKEPETMETAPVYQGTIQSV